MSAHKMTLWLIHLSVLHGKEEAAAALLPEDRRGKLEQLRVAEDRLGSLAAGLLLRRVLGVCEDGKLCENDHGKPFLPDGPHFNLSHGGDLAVLAVSDLPVGVDVEQSDVLPAVMPKRAFAREEWTYFEEEPTAERFWFLWTRLESTLKADGRGFALEKRDFSVTQDGKPWYLYTSVCHGHTISCAMSEPFEVEFHELTADELLK